MKWVLIAVACLTASIPSAGNAQTTACSAIPDHLVSAAEVIKLAKVAKKGEYETTEAFQARLSALLPGGTVAAVVPVDASLTSYDADSQSLSIHEYGLPLADKIIDTSSTFVGWLAPLSEVRKKTGSYIGQNGFGARTKVSREAEEQVGIAWDSPHFNPDADLKVSMSPAMAKNVRSELQIMIVGTLAAPYAARASQQSDVTVDSPIDLTKNQVGIVVAPVCAAIIDGHGHQILASWPAATGYKPSYLP